MVTGKGAGNRHYPDRCLTADRTNGRSARNRPRRRRRSGPVRPRPRRHHIPRHNSRDPPPVVAGTVALRRDGAADDGAGSESREEGAATAAMIATTATESTTVMVTAAAKARSTAAAAKALSTASALAHAAAGWTGIDCAALDAGMDLGKTRRRHRDRQNQSHCGCGTQNFQTDHCRLQWRDTSNPLDGCRFPSPPRGKQGCRTSTGHFSPPMASEPHASLEPAMPR